MSPADQPDELLDAFADHLADRIADRVVTRMREGEPNRADDEWLDTLHAAEHLGVHRDTLRKLAAAGLIPSEQDAPGCKRYFRRSGLDEWRARGGAPARLRSVA